MPPVQSPPSIHIIIHPTLGFILLRPLAGLLQSCSRRAQAAYLTSLDSADAASLATLPGPCPPT